MAKVKISISRIKCLRTTWEISPDEIYYVLYFFSGEVDSAGHPVIDVSKRQVRASEIMENVVRDLSWKPAPSEQIFELGEAKAFGFLLLLGEKDNGKFYEKIMNGDATTKFVELNPQLPTIPNNPGDWKSWIPVITKFLATLVRDLFGSASKPLKRANKKRRLASAASHTAPFPAASEASGKKQRQRFRYTTIYLT